MRTLHHLSAFIIYAGTDTGHAIAERYAALNTKLILHLNADEPPARQLISNIMAMGTLVSSVPGQVSNESGLRNLFTQVEHICKMPDIITINDEKKVFDFDMLRYAATKISGRGRLIYIVPIGLAEDLERFAGWIEQLAHENASRDTTVNAVMIPPNETALIAKTIQGSDIADAVEFFASDLATLITGQYLVLNTTPTFPNSNTNRNK